MPDTGRVGEIVEVAAAEYLAQSYALHAAPAIGTFVRTGHEGVDVIGVVAGSRTAGVDPSRRPIARGEDEDDEDALYRHNPELPELLRTEFAVRLVGFGRAGRYSYFLPPVAPRLHGFVYRCLDDEVIALTEQLTFLRTLLQPGLSWGAPPDELVGATIRAADRARGGDRAFRIRAGKVLVGALLNDVPRLEALLRSFQQLSESVDSSRDHL
ncbi:MAG: hypothetical protein HYY04_10590 [Chloroflexi bacterium]|nr:hypothetical protein [Chloroflexota bacterium]